MVVDVLKKNEKVLLNLNKHAEFAKAMETELSLLGCSDVFLNRYYRIGYTNLDWLDHPSKEARVYSATRRDSPQKMTLYL